MEPPPEYTLNYHFDFRSSKDLKPGDYLASSIPPTFTVVNGQSVIISPAGFPIPLSLHLLHRKVTFKSDDFVFICRLPTHVPFIPPLLIQPTCLPTDREEGANQLDRRLVGLQQPAAWGFTLSVAPIQVRPGGQQLVSVSIPPELSGEFRFKLLDEPAHIIANLPPSSKADWSCLPRDMVSAVLRELPLADKVSARLVCHSWACILDSDSRTWSNVTYVETFHGHLECDLEGPYDYHMGWRNQVRDSLLLQALEFLVTRGARIRTLELNQEPSVLLEDLKDLPSTLTNLSVELKTLAVRSQYSWFEDFLDEDETALVNLIKSQPSLERLYLDISTTGLSPSLLPAMPHLRVLSLRVCDQDQVEELRNQAQLLQSLEGLCLSFHDIFTEADGNGSYGDLASLSDILHSLGLDLRRVSGVEWAQGPPLEWQGQKSRCACGGFVHPCSVAWGTGGLSPAAAAVLLQPVHGQPLCHFRI